MPKTARLAVYWTFGTLWFTGCAWLILNQWFESTGPFGRSPHPLEPALLLMHGILAVASLYLLGWVSARHVRRWWTGGVRRMSGGILAAFFAVLTLTGFALFFVSDDLWQHAAGTAHDVLGVAVTVFAIQHWVFARRRDMRSAASRPW
jgi:hypothetical protein